MFKLVFKNFIAKKEFIDSKSLLTNVDYVTGLFNKSLQSIKKANLFLEQYPEYLTVFSKISGLDFQTAFAINSIYIKNIKPLAFGILGSLVTKNLSSLDKIDYFESTFLTPAYLFFISLLSASFMFFTNQPVSIVDQDGGLSLLVLEPKSVTKNCHYVLV